MVLLPQIGEANPSILLEGVHGIRQDVNIRYKASLVEN